jgi:NTF2 fold immunity protein
MYSTLKRVIVLWAMTLIPLEGQSMLPSSAQAQEKEDISMLLYRAGHTELVSQDLAISVATAVFRKIYGEEDFETQLPLRVTDGGDRWIIDGSRVAKEYSTPADRPEKGNVEIIILKVNCQIVKLIQNGYLKVPSKNKEK